MPYGFVVLWALQHRLTIGDVALYAGLVFEVRRSLYTLIGNATLLQQVSLGAAAFFELLDYRETGEEKDATVSEKSEKATSSTGADALNGTVHHPGRTYRRPRSLYRA